MAGGPGQVAKAALTVYDQWEREWVTRLQKNDQRMTYSDWIREFVLVAEKFRAGCSTTYLNATYLWTDESAGESPEPLDGAELFSLYSTLNF